MQRMMPWKFYNFAKLLKKRTLDSNMHLQPMKKIDWNIFFGHLLIVLIDTKKMEMWLFFILLNYKVNVYEMPFGIFVGVNNHGKTILFGCALLRNETTSAFRWLMKVHSLSYKFVQLFFKFYLIN